MSNPGLDAFMKSLSPDDIDRLTRLLKTLRRIDGWCSVNRSIAKFGIFGFIAILIILSQGLDAIKNIFGFKH